MEPFTPAKKLIPVLAMLFIVEGAVMAVINYFQLSLFLEAVIDSSALILVAMPILYIQFIRPMTRQYRVAVEARRTAETLRTISMELSQTLDLNSVMDILVKHVTGLVQFDFVSFYLLQSPFWLVTKAARGYEIETGAEGLMSAGFDPRNNPVILRILTEQKSIAVNDTKEMSGWAYHTGAMHDGSWLGIPLIAGGKVIGLCAFGKLDLNVYLEETVRLAEGVVSHAAVAIQNAALFEKVRSGHERLQTLTHKIVSLQENERLTVARDLYDEVGQAVVSVLYQLRLLEQKADNPQDIRSSVGDLDRELSSIIENLHNLAVKLRPASLDHLGLYATIQHDLVLLREKYGLEFQFEALGLTERLPEAMETTLYRIMNEALDNVIQHSRASQVEVLLRQENNQLILTLEDNGIGFNLEAVDQNRCYGLLDMQERAEMIDGKLKVETSPGSGTSITISVPYPALTNDH